MTEEPKGVKGFWFGSSALALALILGFIATRDWMLWMGGGGTWAIFIPAYLAIVYAIISLCGQGKVDLEHRKAFAFVGAGMAAICGIILAFRFAGSPESGVLLAAVCTALGAVAGFFFAILPAYIWLLVLLIGGGPTGTFLRGTVLSMDQLPSPRIAIESLHTSLAAMIALFT